MTKYDKAQQMDLAARAIAKENFAEAIAALEVVRAHDKKDPYLLGKLGELYQRVGDLNRAAASYVALAEVSKEGGFLARAAAALRKATECLPARADLHMELGDVLARQQLKLDASAQYLLAADAYEASSLLVEALGALARLTELDPKNTMALARMAELYARQNAIPQACQCLRTAAALLRDPAHEAEYLKVMQRLSFLDPTDADALCELGRLYLKQKDPAHALRKLKLAFKARPRDPATLELLAEAFRQNGETERAVVVLRELARERIDRKELGAAKTALRTILSLKPDDAEAQAQLAVL